jgi:hypothetical protein
MSVVLVLVGHVFQHVANRVARVHPTTVEHDPTPVGRYLTGWRIDKADSDLAQLGE